MKHYVGQTNNGTDVYVDLIRSEAAKQIAQQPHLLGLVAEALQQITPQGTLVDIEHDMGRAIGYSFVIRTTDTDPIFYAQLLKEDTYTRFIKNGKPLATRHLTLHLRLNEESNEYELHDVWMGRLSPPRPGSAGETAESKSYWSNHAFILGNQPLQLRTVTKVCPY